MTFKTDELKITYTQAIIEYRNWKFIISPEDKPSVSEEVTFEIKVLHDKLYGDGIYLTNTLPSFIAPDKIISFDEAVNKVKDFIKNELK